MKKEIPSYSMKSLPVYTIIIAAFISGCNDLDMGEIPFKCGENEQGIHTRCPRGYTCSNGYCFRDGIIQNGTPAGNVRPIAFAGEDRTVKTGEEVQLDGNGIDPLDRTLSLEWTQISGLEVELSDSFVANPTFFAPLHSGILVFSLTAITDDIVSEPDILTITVIESDESKCGTISDNCRFIEVSDATGDFESNYITRNETALFASRTGGLIIAEVPDGCVFLTAMLLDEERAEFRQTFRISSNYPFRLLESIEIGPLNWLTQEHAGPDDANIFISLLNEDQVSLGTVSRSTSLIGGNMIRFDFSSHNLILANNQTYTIRFFTDLPIGSDDRIAWLSEKYNDPDCPDEHGNMRINDDPHLTLQYCSSEGVCDDPMEVNGVFSVEATPVAHLQIGDQAGQIIDISTLNAELTGSILFDLDKKIEPNQWIPELNSKSFDELTASGLMHDKFRLTAHFKGRPASISCASYCFR